MAHTHLQRPSAADDALATILGLNSGFGKKSLLIFAMTVD